MWQRPGLPPSRGGPPTSQGAGEPRRVWPAGADLGSGLALSIGGEMAPSLCRAHGYSLRRPPSATPIPRAIKLAADADALEVALAEAVTSGHKAMAQIIRVELSRSRRATWRELAKIGGGRRRRGLRWSTCPTKQGV